MSSPNSSPTTTSTYKLLLMGDSGTGKSSLLLRFTEDKFLGVDFKVKFLDLTNDDNETTTRQPPRRVKLTIWDTAGQERFRTLTSSYYRGAQGVILVFDVCNRESFDNLRGTWLTELSTYASMDQLVLMVVGNKIDKDQQRVVSAAEGQELARSLEALYMECSAKTRVGVQAAFEDLVHKIMHSPKLQQTQSDRSSQPKQSTAMLTDQTEGGGLGESSCAC